MVGPDIRPCVSTCASESGRVRPGPGPRAHTCVTGWNGTMGRTAGTDAPSMVMVMLTLMVTVMPVVLRPAPLDQHVTPLRTHIAAGSSYYVT